MRPIPILALVMALALPGGVAVSQSSKESPPESPPTPAGEPRERAGSEKPPKSSQTPTGAARPPTRIIPTEKIPLDTPVSFPADI